MSIRIEDLAKTDFRSVAVAGGKRIAPTSPGEMLREEFLKPMGLTNYRLAKEINVPAQRIGDIIAGKRGITAETDLRLCRFFGLTDGWWLRLQGDYDTRLARAVLAKKLAKIKPWSAHLEAKA
ncbi:MAG: HigA family addiction module antitoxin [Steroidobacteraceae bacterium]